MWSRLPLLVFLVFCLHDLAAQENVLNRKITLKIRKQPLEEILRQIEKKADVSFSYNTKLIPSGDFNLNANNDELDVVLINLLTPLDLGFSLLYGNHIVIHRNEKKARKYTVSGYVTDELTGEKIIGVNIYNQLTLNSTVTNQDGYYSLTLDEDSVYLVFSRHPYVQSFIKFNLVNNTRLDVQLNEAKEMPPYKITARPDNQNRFLPDRSHLSSMTLKQLPVLFGETDVMKGLQLMPGVSSGNDGTIGLNVRGGGPDQNLILLDDVPIYNPSHIYGFFSVFNSDIVKDVQLIKGGTSARYSGRLSSVVDVRTLDGNKKMLRSQVSLGILSSKLTIDGPIGASKKTTFILSARRSYIDLLNAIEWSPILKSQYSPLKSGYYFFDANGKVNHEFNKMHSMAISFYTGKDNLFIRNSFSLKNPQKEISEKDRQAVFWGNTLFALRDHHIWTPRLSGILNLAFTSYNFGNESSYEYSENTDTQQLSNNFDYRFVSRINNSIGSYNLEYKMMPWMGLKGGLGFVFHEFEREIRSSDNIVTTANNGNSKNVANEYNTYVEMYMRLRRKVNFNLGANQVLFDVKGKRYWRFQPRFSFDYRPMKQLVVHGGFQRTVQFLHLLTSASSGIPIDLWLPSTVNVAPEYANTWSGGVSYSRSDWVLNAEAFWKKMGNIIDYKDQANYIGANADWEQKITVGEGEAHGYEFMLEKRNGKTKGWLSYTLSWNNRKFADINGGKVFPYRYDRRHNIAVFVGHEFNKRIDASMSWVFNSGAHYTMPEQVYFLNSGLSPNNIVYVYGERNNYQLPYYHRMDIGVNFKKSKTRYSRHFSIGAYNVYNRLNPFYITPAYNKEGQRVFEAISLFPFLPSVNYKILF